MNDNRMMNIAISENTNNVSQPTLAELNGKIRALRAIQLTESDPEVQEEITNEIDEYSRQRDILLSEKIVVGTDEEIEGEVTPSISEEITNVSIDLRKKIAEARARRLIRERPVDSPELLEFDDEEFAKLLTETRISEENTINADLQTDESAFDQLMNETALEKYPLPDIEDEQMITDEQSLEIEFNHGHEVIDELFEKQFGVTSTELEQIDGYSELSEAQKRLVFENLAQLTLGKIYQESMDAQKQDYNEQRAALAKLGRVKALFGKAWIGIKENFLARTDLVERQQQLAISSRSGGLEMYREQLVQLIVGVSKNGPEVSEGEDGNLELSFVGKIDGISDEAKEVIDLLDQSANALAKIPMEDGYETSPVAEQRRCRDAVMKYKHHLNEAIEVMRESGMSEKDIVMRVAMIEQRVSNNRFLVTSPDAVQELESIKDKNVWIEGAKYLSSNQGMYASLGFIGRSVLSGVMSFTAAPLVSSALAGFREWGRSGAELREQDRSQRMGLSEGERNEYEKLRSDLRAVEALINTNAELGASDRNEQERLLNEREMLEGRIAEMARGKEIRSNMIDAVGKYGAVTKMNLLRERLASVEDMLAIEKDKLENAIASRVDTELILHEVEVLGQKRAKLLDSIKDRVIYIEDKIRLGKVSFGSANTQIQNRSALLSELAQAKVIAEDSVGNKKIQDRLEIMLNKKEGSIQGARINYRMNKVRKGMLVGAGFSLLGALARDWYSAEGVFSAGGESHGKNYAEGKITSYDSSESVIPGEVVEQSPPIEEDPAQKYEVKPGDTLSKIIIDNVSEIRDLGQGKVRQIALANFLRTLTPEDLSSIGVTGGNIDQVVPGQRINVAKIEELLAAKTINGSTVVDDAMRRYGVSEPYTPEVKTVPAEPSISVNDAQMEALIAKSEKVDVILDLGTKSLFKGQEAVWESVSSMNVVDLLKLTELSSDSPEDQPVIALKSRLAPYIQMSQPKINESVEQFLRRSISAIYDASANLQTISRDELIKMLNAPQTPGTS